MKQSIKFLLLVFATVAFTLHSKAQQNSYPVLSTSVETACVLNCFDADTVPVISDISLITVQMVIQLFEFTGVESIRVKLGTIEGGTDLLDKTFAFDVSGNVGNGCTYSRTDYTVTLGLGSYNGLTSYFSEVILERADHSLTEAIIFNR